MRQTFRARLVSLMDALEIPEQVARNLIVDRAVMVNGHIVRHPEMEIKIAWPGRAYIQVAGWGRITVEWQERGLWITTYQQPASCAMEVRQVDGEPPAKSVHSQAS